MTEKQPEDHWISTLLRQTLGACILFICVGMLSLISVLLPIWSYVLRLFS